MLLDEKNDPVKEIGNSARRNVSYQAQGWVRLMKHRFSVEKQKGVNMGYINIGVDLGIEAPSTARIVNDKGEELGHKYSFPITKESLDKLYARARSYAQPGDGIRIIIEPTNMIWFPVAIYGKAQDCEVVRVKAHKVHDLRRFYARNKKDDGLDALTLAMMPIVDRKGIEELYLPPAENFALTRRVRQRERLVQDLTAQKNRLESLLGWMFSEVTKYFSDPFGNVAKMFYRYYANPFTVVKKTPEELAEHLTAVSGEKVELATAQAICRCAAEACALYEHSEPYVNFEELAREILPEIDLLDVYQEQIKEVELEIERLYKALHPQKQIESVPGVGKNLGPALLGVISDAQRFKGEKRCRAFMGFIPKQDESATSEKKGLKMSQAGPSSGRRDFYLAANTARQWDPQLAKVYYDEMVHKGHCHTQAVCAVGVRMIGRVLRILKDDRKYELRDTDGCPVTKKEAKEIIKERYIVPEEVRQRTRNKKRERERSSNYSRGCSERNTPNLDRSRGNNSQRRP